MNGYPKSKQVRRAPKPKSKRVKKSERRRLEAELWKLTADYVKARDKVCVTCGTIEKPTLSHWQKAGKQIIRYDTRNGNLQCAPCNNAHNYNTYVYDNYMLRTWGEDEMIELTDLCIKYTSDNFRWSVLQLRQMVEDRNNGMFIPPLAYILPEDRH